MPNKIQIVIALQEALAGMGWLIEVGVARSIATMPSGYGEGGISIDLMQLAETMAKAFDR